MAGARNRKGSRSCAAFLQAKVDSHVGQKSQSSSKPTQETQIQQDGGKGRRLDELILFKMGQARHANKGAQLIG